MAPQRPTPLTTKEFAFASWKEAGEAVGHRLYAPTWLPAGYTLSALQSFAPVPEGASAHELTPTIVDAIYAAPDFRHFRLAQHAESKPSDSPDQTLLTEARNGVFEIGDGVGYWVEGVRVRRSGSVETQWDSAIRSVEWRWGGSTLWIRTADLDITTLVRVARSVAEQ